MRGLAALLLLAALPSAGSAALNLVSSTTIDSPGTGGFDDFDEGRAVVVDSDGKVYAAGIAVEVSGGGNAWLGKFDPNLVLLGSVTFLGPGGGNDGATALALSGSNLFTAGYAATGAANDTQSVWVAKYDTNLVLLASAAFNGPGDQGDSARGIAVGGGSVFVLANISTAPSPTFTKVIWLGKYDADLVLIASATLGVTSTDGGITVSGSDIFVTGTINIDPNAPTGDDIWVAKYDSSLVLKASATYNNVGSGQDRGRGLTVDTGNVYVGGSVTDATFFPGFTFYRPWLGKFTRDLVFVSSFTEGGTLGTAAGANGIALDGAGRLYAAGQVPANSGDIWVGQFDTSLVFQSSRTFDGPASGGPDDIESAFGVAVSAQNIYAIGGINTSSSFKDIWLGRFTEQAAAPVLAFASTTVDSSFTPDRTTRLAEDRSGNQHALYSDKNTGNGNTRLVYRKRTGGVWGGAIVVAAGTGSNPFRGDLALDGNGNPVAGFYDSETARVKLGSWNGAGFTISTVTADSPSDARFGLDGLGNPHFIVDRPQQNGGARYLRWDGAAFVTQTVLDTLGNNIGGGTAISNLVVTGDGSPVFLFTTGTKVEGARRNMATGVWTAFSVDTGTSAVNLAIALDADERLHAVYATPGNILKYALSSPGMTAPWTFSTVEDGASKTGMGFSYATLALDGSGRPHAGYAHGTPCQGILHKYARLESGTWTPQTVHSGGNCSALPPSVVVGGNGEVQLLDGRFTGFASAGIVYSSTTGAGFSAPMGGNPYGRVQAPSGFTPAAIHATSATWSWTDNAANESGFRLYGGSSSTGPFTLIAGTATIAASGGTGGLKTFTEIGLDIGGGTQYFRYVAAVNAGGAVFSSSATTAAPAQSTVTASAFTSVLGTSLTANWASTFPSGTQYFARLSTDAAFAGTVLSSDTFNLSASFGGLAFGTTYHARVATAAAGPFVALGSTRTLDDFVAPAAIMTLSALARQASGEIQLSWTAPADPGQSSLTGSYLVHFSSFVTTFSTASAQVVIATAAAAPGAAEARTLTGLVLGATYYIRVFAADARLNYSPVSNGATAQAGLGGVVSPGVPATGRPYGRDGPLVRDTGGALYAVYAKFFAAASSTQVFVASSTDAGLTWTDMGAAPIAVIAGHEQMDPVLAIDSLNQLHAVWAGKDAASPNDLQLKHSRFTGGAWTSPVAVTNSPGFPQQAPSIEVDGSNRVHAVWKGTDASDPVFPQIRYARFESGAWSAAERIAPIANYAQGDPLLALDPAGRPHAIWYGGDAANAANAQIKYSSHTGSAWTPVVNIARIAGHFQCHPAIAISTDGAVHVVWTGADAANPTPDWQIKYSSYSVASGTWSAFTNLSSETGFRQLFPSIAIDAAGRIYALWNGPDAAHAKSQIKLAVRDGPSWSAPQNKTELPAADQQWPALRWSQFNLNGGPLSWLWRDLGGPSVRADPDEATLMGAGSMSVLKAASVGAGALAVDAAQPGGYWTAQVRVPAGGFPEGTPFLVDAAAAAPAPPAGSGWRTAGALEVSAGGLQPAAPVALEFAYGETLTSALGLAAEAPREFMIARYEPASGWVALPTTHDTAARRVRAETSHLSLFGLFALGPSAGSLDRTFVFPAPWKPGSGGRFDSPAGQAGPVFANLPAAATIRLYTLDGVRVRTIPHSGGTTRAWDGKNDSGAEAASGVYLAVIESGGDSARLRVAVVR